MRDEALDWVVTKALFVSLGGWVRSGGGGACKLHGMGAEAVGWDNIRILQERDKQLDDVDGVIRSERDCEYVVARMDQVKRE